MNLYQHIGEIPTSIGQGFEGLFSYDHYSQPSSAPPSYHPSPHPSYAGQYNYGQDSQLAMISAHHNLPNHPLMLVISACHQIHGHVLQTLRKRPP